MIFTQNLGKIFNTKNNSITAVEDLNLDIKGSTIAGLFGPNGAGKTTTVRMLATIYRPSTGGGTVAGFDLLTEKIKIRKRIGYAPELPGLYERLTARRNLKFFASMYDIPKAKQNTLIEELMGKFGLIDSIDHNVGAYSKGMKQKLSIIKALLHDPEVLLLDEPWTGLSPLAARDLRGLISELGDSRTVLVTTHNLAQAEMIVDKILIIAHGKKIADASPAELRQQYTLKPIVRVDIDPTDNIDDVLSSSFINSFEVETDKYMKLNISISSFEKTPDLIADMVNNGLRVHHVQEIIPSLEEVYINLVGKEVEK